MSTDEHSTQDPQVDEEKLAQAKKSATDLNDRYEPGTRATVSVPGTGGTVAGTAFADMVEEMSDSDRQEAESHDKTNEDKVREKESDG